MVPAQDERSCFLWSSSPILYFLLAYSLVPLFLVFVQSYKLLSKILGISEFRNFQVLEIKITQVLSTTSRSNFCCEMYEYLHYEG